MTAELEKQERFGQRLNSIGFGVAFLTSFTDGRPVLTWTLGVVGLAISITGFCLGESARRRGASSVAE